MYRFFWGSVYIKLQVSISQKLTIPVNCMNTLSLYFVLSIHNSDTFSGITKNLHCGLSKKNFRSPRYYVINILKLEYLCYLLSD